MTIFDRHRLIVVFDLDDTLYPEKEYLFSGVRAVAQTIFENFGTNIEDEVVAFVQRGEKDFLGEICRIMQWPISSKESLLWAYRLHEPKISLSKDVRGTIDELNDIGIPMAIITDGRTVTQRLKLVSLGLDDIPAYISEQWQSEKPQSLRFELVMQKFPNRDYVYVGDNPVKDFIAPKKLGWSTVQLTKKPYFIHYGDEKVGLANAADLQIENIPELLELVE